MKYKQREKMRNDEGKRGGEQKGKRNRGEMVVHEKNLYMGEWDEVAKRSKVMVWNVLEGQEKIIEQ
jgi:hypothetical protein